MRNKVSDLQPTGRNVKVTVKRILEKIKTKIGENETDCFGETCIRPPEFLQDCINDIAKKGCLLCFWTEFQEAVC